MAIQQAETVVDVEAVEQLSERFADVFRTLNGRQGVFAPDVFFDLNVPVWRFQLQGVEAVEAWLRELASEGYEVDILRTVPTATGFVTEHEGSQQQEDGLVSFRHLWLCEVSNGRIVEVVGYCSGEWDEELRARHANEAPMIRP